jgi:hypothetical protein
MPGTGGERLENKIFLAWSLVHHAVASRKPRPKVVSALTVATFLFVEVPRHLEGMCGEPSQLDKKS